MKMKIVISPDGKVIKGLYSDKFPWCKFGNIEIKRASDVFFEAAIQKWKIKILCTQEVLPVECSSREHAIAYERKYLESDDFTQAKKRFDERIRNFGCTEANFI